MSEIKNGRVLVGINCNDKIRAFDADRDFIKQVTGTIEGMGDVLREIKDKNIAIHGLTNWAGDTFDTLPGAFPEILSKFNSVVVSGKIGIKKPNPAIFRHAQQAFGNLAPQSVWYFDDKPGNVATAQSAVGWNAAVFENADTVRTALGLQPKR